MVPVPGLFLSAVARATERIRLGPLTYLLPLYSPLRLIEEICMLDHLSHGRLDLGVGRGVSPYEMNYHNVDMASSIEVFNECLEATVKGLTNDRLTFKGKHFNYTDVPMVLRPLQQPYPPIWYPSSSEFGANLAGENGYDFVTLGGLERGKQAIDTYKKAYAKRSGPNVPGSGLPGGTAIGILRQVVLADTEADAMKIARPAYDRWYDNLTKLQRDNVNGPNITAHMPKNIDEGIAAKAAIVGTPDKVVAELKSQIEFLGVNYMILGCYIGTIAYEHAMRSIDLFAREVMPKLAAL